MILLALVASLQVAASPPFPITLDAPRACGVASDLEAELARCTKSGRSLAVLRVDVTVRAMPHGHRVVLSVTTRTGTGQRSLVSRGPQCSEAVRTAALALCIALDPTFGVEPAPVPEQPLAETTRRERAGPLLVLKAPRAPPERPQVDTDSPALAQTELRVQFTLEAGVLPTASPGCRLGVDLSWGDAYGFIEASVAGGETAPSWDNGPFADVLLSSVGAGACLAPGLLRVCAFARVGAHTLEVHGVERSEDDLAGYLALGARLGFDALLGSRSRLVLDLDATGAPWRGRFTASRDEGGDVVLFEPESWAVTLGLGLSFALPP